MFYRRGHSNYTGRRLSENYVSYQDWLLVTQCWYQTQNGDYKTPTGGCEWMREGRTKYELRKGRILVVSKEPNIQFKYWIYQIKGENNLNMGESFHRGQKVWLWKMGANWDIERWLSKLKHSIKNHKNKLIRNKKKVYYRIILPIWQRRCRIIRPIRQGIMGNHFTDEKDIWHVVLRKNSNNNLNRICKHQRSFWENRNKTNTYV